MNVLDLSSLAFAKVIEATIPASILAAIVFALQGVLRQRLSPGWYFPARLRPSFGIRKTHGRRCFRE
jgi:hypothetical protein